MNTTGALAARRSRTPRSSSNSRPWAEPIAQARTRCRRSGDGPEVGDQPGQLGAALPEDGVELVGVGAADEPAQGLDDRRVRQRALAEVDAAAEQDDGALAPGDRGDLGDEPRLADAGLAGDRSVALLRPSRAACRDGAQPAELAGSADEDGAGDADRHAVDYHAGHGVPSPGKRRDVGRVRTVTMPRSRARAGARSRTASGRPSGGRGRLGHRPLPERRSRRRSASSMIFCRRASANTSAL